MAGSDMMVETEIQTQKSVSKATELQTSEAVVVDPNIQMLHVEDVAKLRENGIATGGYSLYLARLDDLNLGSQINGAAFRRDKRGSLFLDIFVAINPDELSRRSDYKLKGELNVNPWAHESGANPLEARVSEFLGEAPKGPIAGMISEVKRPVGEKPNQMRFKADSV
jgi:hypothetical protein